MILVRVTIRRSVFETNSSSTHSLTMCMKDEFDKWKNGELLFNVESDSFIPNKRHEFTEEDMEDMKRWYEREYNTSWENRRWNHTEKYVKRIYAQFLDWGGYEDEVYSYEEYSNGNLEYFADKYTTPNGETIVAFGTFGYDG